MTAPKKDVSSEFMIEILDGPRVVATRGGLRNTWGWLVMILFADALMVVAPFVLEPKWMVHWPIWASLPIVFVQVMLVLGTLQCLRDTAYTCTIAIGRNRQSVETACLGMQTSATSLTGKFRQVTLRRIETKQLDMEPLTSWEVRVSWAIAHGTTDSFAEIFLDRENARETADTIGDLLQLPVDLEPGFLACKRDAAVSSSLIEALEQAGSHTLGLDEFERQIDHYKMTDELPGPDSSYSSEWLDAEKELGELLADELGTHRDEVPKLLSYLGVEDCDYLFEVYLILSEDLHANGDLMRDEFDRLVEVCLDSSPTDEVYDDVAGTLSAFGRVVDDHYPELWDHFMPTIQRLTRSELRHNRYFGIRLLSVLQPDDDTDAEREYERLKEDPDWKIRVLAYRYHNCMKDRPSVESLSLADRLRERFCRVW